MEVNYTSYLIRNWSIGVDTKKVEVEHIQSNKKTRVSSLADALSWIESKATAR